ncbi:toll-like receptor 2 [Babylonia areolata]|uniref:toll-like receptor 2 n=1 Tax=Babylonia areolata TaxID=304850 RepID=UPI003FD4A872
MMARRVVCCYVWLLCQFVVFPGEVQGPPSAVGSEPLTSTLTIPPAEAPCGDGLCTCTQLSADCVGRLAQVTYIPKLPEQVRYVDLSLNNFSSADLTDYFFENLTNVVNLNLSFNSFTLLSRDVFEGMVELCSLILSNNEKLDLESIREVLSVQGLDVVEAENCNLPPPPENFFENITTTVAHLSLGSNPHGGSYPLDGFCVFEFLFYIKLCDCDFNDITSSCQVPFGDLDLSGNTLRKFPQTCIGEESVFPSLETLWLAHNEIDSLSASDVCLPLLEYLDLSFNRIISYPTGAFQLETFPVLDYLDVRHQFHDKGTAMVLEDGAFNNPSLQTIDLRDNQLQIANPSKTGKHAFANCFGVRNLLLDWNDFTDVDDLRFLELFSSMPLLTYLSLANTKLNSILSKAFPKFRYLQALYIHDNIISSVPDGAFDSFQGLTELYLHNNRIKSISPNTFGQGLRGRLITLTLGLNPWDCSCELLWFQAWFQSEPDVFTGLMEKVTDYKCSNVPALTLADFHMDQQACALSREANLALIHITVVVIVALTVVILAFRFRWHFRLLLYEVFRGRDNLRRQRLQADNFDFDVFVSYACEDLHWVRQHLEGRLEGELGLRLCLHQRDFLPGRHIVDNIVHSVDSSKKILMVFSANFLSSHWCQFELSVCLTHALDFDDSLIVVCVDDVISRDMTSAMRAVLKTTTYIQWSEGEGEEAVASWRRLHLALHEILPNGHNHV